MIWWTLRQLKSVDPLKRIRAASTLGATGDPAHVDVLIRTLADRYREVRVAAIEALAKIGDRRAIGPLAQAMRHPDKSVASQAVEALESFGEATAVEPLADGLCDANVEVRERCARRLAYFEDPQVLCRILDRLTAAAEDSSRSVRQHVAYALGKTGDPRALQPLVALLRDRDLSIQQSSAVQLGCLGDPGAIQALLDMFEKTPRRELRERILQSLEMLGHPTDTLRERIGIFDPIALILSLGEFPGYGNEFIGDGLKALISQFQREGLTASDRLAEIIGVVSKRPSDYSFTHLLWVAKHVQLTPKLEAALTEVAAHFAPEIRKGSKISYEEYQELKSLVETAKAALKR